MSWIFSQTLYGLVVWSCCMVLLYGLVVWSCCMVLLYGLVAYLLCCSLLIRLLYCSYGYSRLRVSLSPQPWFCKLASACPTCDSILILVRSYHQYKLSIAAMLGRNTSL
ncbi:hypothetical protein F5883DRAFT_15168 [Diaporthe sp. PMI_573]|nr:hypothetical protein F5883DRAFT_15168 [Diaporthaceae sp. PMI_573]